MRSLLFLCFILSLIAFGCAEASSEKEPTDTQNDVQTDDDTTTDVPGDDFQPCTGDESCPTAQYCDDQGTCRQDCLPGSPSCGAGFICSERGRCEGVDDCEGVTCTTPPENGCVDGIYSVYQASGACERDRGCVYPSAMTNCEHGCADDVCAECSATADCVLGTAPFCRDNELVTPVAGCDQGLCTTTESVEACEFGCANLACRPSPCEGVSCQSQPAPTCDNDNTVIYQSTGTCVPTGDESYECQYEVDESAGDLCATGCTNGYCNDDPCSSHSCDSTPDDTCDGDDLHIYSGAGICSSESGVAECVYTPTVTSCENGCGDATCYECNGPEDCPSGGPTCDGSDRLYVSAICSEHICSDQVVRETCPYGCQLGECINPCAGVVCDSPQAAFCADAATLTTYAEMGTCEVDSSNLPSCVYEVIDVPCGDGLVCETDGCEVPPSPNVDWCRVQWPEDFEGNGGDFYAVYLRVYEAGVTDITAYSNEADYGTMSGQVGYGPVGTDPGDASWIWFAAEVNTGFTGGTSADNDEFMAELTLPAASGNYDVAGRFTNDSTNYTYCDTGAEGSANGYDSADASTLFVYATDPCDGYLCDAPPEPACVNSTTLSEATLTEGVCASSSGLPECDYSLAETYCPDEGKVCVDGECVAPSVDATLVFESNWDEYVVGSLHQGGTMKFDYDPERLPNCRATYNGYDAWSILLHYSFDGGAHWDYVPFDSGTVIDVPTGVIQVQIYADNTDRYGCHEYDSNMGANYWFTIN